jgi:hypothetical protein
MIGGLRELAWAMAAILVAVLIAYVLVLLFPREVQSEAIPPIVPSVYNTRLDELDRLAVEEAYRVQVEHLFSNWMKDPTGQPTRALNGQRMARRAYIEIMATIDARK